MVDLTYQEGALSAAQRAELVNELATILLSAGERRSYTANMIIRDPIGDIETARARFGLATPSDARSRTVAGFAPSPRPDRRRPSSR